MAANVTQVFQFAGALFVIDQRISAEDVAIKIQDENGALTYWIHPDKWAEITAEQPHIPARLKRAPATLERITAERLQELYHKAGGRPLMVDDFARAKAERVNRVK